MSDPVARKKEQLPGVLSVGNRVASVSRFF